MDEDRSALSPRLLAIVDALLAATPEGGEVTLDALGDALGVLAVTPDEIDRMIDLLERAGRTVGTAPGGQGTERLRVVLDAARALRAEGKTPSPTAIAERTGMELEHVKHALALAKVMQR